jgi:hypothetical protein
VRSIGTVVTVTALSLGTWVFFYEEDMRLTASETTVVVGGCLAIVLLTQWLWVRLRNKKSNKKSKVAKRAKVLVVAFLASFIALGRRDGQALFAAASSDKRENDTAELKSSLLVACSPDKPAVRQDESVVLRAWATAPPPQKLRYTWVVTAGAISGQGSEVRWDLKGVSAGIYKADVKVEDGTTPGSGCSTRVAVMEPERGSVVRESGRAFLLKGKNETTGYGLYSYLLLGSSPAEDARQRYLATLQAYLRMISDVAKLEDYVPRARLNITYLPLESAAPEAVDATWLLGHYDYARARVLLDDLPGNLKEGIYLVSSLKPLSGGPNPPYLLQDLTTVPTQPPDLISWWVREFLNQAAQERYWEPKTVEIFALKLRTTISVLAMGLPEVQKSVTGWVSWVH